MEPLTTVVVMGSVLGIDVGSLSFGFSELEVPLLRTVGFVVGFVVVLFVGWVFVEPAVSRIVSRRNRNNPTLEEAIARYVRLTVVLCALFVGLSGAGFAGPVRNSALVIAAGTLALGVAGQSVIGSLVSGIALVVDSQFNVGDYIRWEDGEGEVASITLRVTRVRTPDGGLVTIPNTTLTDDPIVRPFERGNRRVVERIAIDYEDDVETALQLLTETLGTVDGVLDDPAPGIGVDELGDDAVALRVQYWVDDPRRSMLRVRSEFARAAKARLERAGVTISPASKRDLEGHILVDGNT